MLLYRVYRQRQETPWWDAGLWTLPHLWNTVGDSEKRGIGMFNFVDDQPYYLPRSWATTLVRWFLTLAAPLDSLLAFLFLLSGILSKISLVSSLKRCDWLQNVFQIWNVGKDFQRKLLHVDKIDFLKCTPQRTVHCCRYLYQAPGYLTLTVWF